MSKVTRRTILLSSAAAASSLAARAMAVSDRHRDFIEAAFRMRDEAVQSGDQAHGAVLVKDGRIAGFGPSRVVLKKEWDAHAEREAIRDAQARLGSRDLSGSVLYSSSRPCANCQAVAAEANVARMIYGRDATDGGAPRRN